MLNLGPVIRDDDVADAVVTQLLAERDMDIQMQGVMKLPQCLGKLPMAEVLRPVIQARIRGIPMPRCVEIAHYGPVRIEVLRCAMA